MIYIANKIIKHVPKGTEKVFIFKPGDEIPDFESWNIHAQRAHINMDWVKKVEEVDKKAKKKAQKSAKTEPKITKTGRKSSKSSQKTGENVAKIVKTMPVEPQVSGPKPETIKCDQCDKELKSAKALKTHKTLAHKE